MFDEHVAPSGCAVVREMSARCTSQPGLLISVVSALGIAAGDRVYLGDMTEGVLADRLQVNKTIGPWSMPLTIAWGSSDEVIAPELQSAYVAELCSSGVALTWQEYPEYSHMAIAQEDSDFIPGLVDWTVDRFSGTPAPPSQC